MATGNAIYPLWKQAIMQELPTKKSLDQGDIDPVQGVYCALVDIDPGKYVYNPAHTFFSEVAPNVQNVPQLLTSATVAGRVFDADTVVYTNVTGAAGTRIGAVVLFRQNETANTSWWLVLYEDTGIIGLPMTPSGGNIIVTWNTQGIFGL